MLQVVELLLYLMRILQVFNRYLERGGEEMSVERVAATLQKSNLVFHCYFDSAHFAELGRSTGLIRQALLMVYNPAAVLRFKRQIAACRPDIILLHNVFPVGSIGIYYTAVTSGLPVLHYVHNFRPFSINGYLWGKDRLILEGLTKNFWPEIFAGAWQDSKLRTAWYGAILTFMHWIGIYRRIDGWLAISKFMKVTFVGAGIPEERIFLLRHCWDVEPESPIEPLNISNELSSSEPTILFFGRLTEAKGLRILLEAWKQLEEETSQGRLIIGGEGPLRDWVIDQQSVLKRLDYVGFVSGEEKQNLLKQCRAMVVPSIWWEPLGLVVFEAFQYNRPVIAAQSGGLIETIIDGETGWLYPSYDATALKDCLVAALKNQSEANRRGKEGRSWVVKHTSSADWIVNFNDIVNEVVEKATQRRASKALEMLKGDHPKFNTKDSCFANTRKELLTRSVKISAYLADQNPGYDRSFGISRMSQIVLGALQTMEGVELEAITSRTSQKAPENVGSSHVLPWGTRRRWVRLLTDHFHPLFRRYTSKPDVHYYPKGYLPLLSFYCQPSVVTIHDTIIQYDEDFYPEWRYSLEYTYWAFILKNTLRHATRILTVSQSSKRHIVEFMERHAIPAKPITVTYEPCAYEYIPQPARPAKENFVLHLASSEPHKRTVQLVQWWLDAEAEGRELPQLHLVGSVPKSLLDGIRGSKLIVKRPFLPDEELQAVYASARALILPSEIEGFGLPALEAFYLGTPVCFVKGTSVEEILAVATSVGGYDLDDQELFFQAVHDAMAMDSEEVWRCGLVLRETYAAAWIADNLVEIFREVAFHHRRTECK